MTILYHFCKEGDQGSLNECYIGITDNYEQRFDKHFSDYCDAPILKRAIAKYGDDIRFSLISEGSREEMLRLESYLRPCPKGWNATAGGGNPPNLKGKVMSQEQKNKISASNRTTAQELRGSIWICEGMEFKSKLEASEYFGVTRKTIKDRCDNPKFENWYRGCK